MAFTNDFGYSHSQWRTYDECARRWWLSKVQMWNGWNAGAPTAKRHAYRLKQMSNVWMLSGRTVHDIARQVVVDGIDLVTAETRYDAMMRQAWREAQGEAKVLFSSDPKRKTNLFELFYTGHGIDDLERYAKLAVNRGRDAVAAVFRSDPYRHVRQEGAEIIEAEEMRQVAIGLRQDATVPVWIVRDLAYRHGGQVWLWDWKTGNPQATDRDQVITYGLGSIEFGEVDRTDQLRLGLAYLKTGTADVFTLTSSAIESIVDKVVRRSAKIKAKLNDPAINDAPASRFPRTTDTSKCRRCELFFACRGHRDLQRPDHNAPGFES